MLGKVKGVTQKREALTCVFYNKSRKAVAQKQLFGFFWFCVSRCGRSVFLRFGVHCTKLPVLLCMACPAVTTVSGQAIHPPGCPEILPSTGCGQYPC